MATNTRRSPLKILLAEDTPVNQKVAMHFLAQLGYQADVVEDGQAVLTRLETQLYDVILMDVQMPKLDGLTVTQRLRSSQHNYRDIPIIAMTANTSEQAIKACMDSGMNDFLGKPLRLVDLERKLQFVTSFLPIADPIVPAPIVPVPIPASSVPERVEPIGTFSRQDWEITWNTLMQVTLNNRSLAIELLQLAVHENHRRIPDLQLAQTEHNYERLRSIAHQIKGSHSNLGLSVVASLSSDLEQAAIDRQEAEIHRLLTAIIHGMRDLEVFVAEKFPEAKMMI